MHRNTVEYRVTKVLDGWQGLGSRNLMDLALALQVCHFLGPACSVLPSTRRRAGGGAGRAS